MREDETMKRRRLFSECDSARRMAVLGIIFIFVLKKFILGIAISTIAAFVCILSVPFVYNYITHIQSLLQNEVDFCKVCD